MINNQEIIDRIRDIYTTTSSSQLRNQIAIHFDTKKTDNERTEFGEVPTPPQPIDNMLNKIPCHIWNVVQPVYEPCCGKGNFVIAIFDKFYEGLSLQYPDIEERCKTIMTKCIYYADISAINVFITTEIMKCHIQTYCGVDELDYKFNKYVGDTLEINTNEIFNINIEDFVVIGNPPYATNPSKQNTKPLYDKFIMKYINSKILMFIIPSKWFIGGKGLDQFRKFMLKRKDIVFIEHENDATKLFGNSVDIEGGINYFMKDSSYNGYCKFNDIDYDLSKYDCILEPKYHKLIDKFIVHEKITNIYKSSGYFKVRTNDKRLRNEGKIKVFVSKQKSSSRTKYINEISIPENFWKVITARANGKKNEFGFKGISTPDEIYTDSYFSFRVNNRKEAESLISYLDTKFTNYIMSIMKISQDISEKTCRYIPIVPLDRIWNDNSVCEYFKIKREDLIY